ncbi:hypothetical protein DM02DRAFT_191785 [Periconia macrospinosa]|uniref:Uncharacterized protein n=1 Tax=Periconia macrospinosa TaxID=97972 RepID=A0A2V1DA52_9PLEO|nr:hypothetical protein DM02DRAFT_191785 [Periconia macrospinosa]
MRSTNQGEHWLRQQNCFEITINHAMITSTNDQNNRYLTLEIEKGYLRIYIGMDFSLFLLISLHRRRYSMANVAFVKAKAVVESELLHFSTAFSHMSIHFSPSKPPPIHFHLFLHANSFISLKLTALQGAVFSAVHFLRRLSSPRALDDLLNHLLHSIPIVCVHGNGVRVEVLGNVEQLLPALLVVYQSQSDTDTSETTGTTDTMQVGLRIRGATVCHGRYILLYVNIELRCR